MANADRFVPYADRSFSIVLSITARMNSSEFRRVLREDGRLVADGGRELAERVERDGFDAFRAASKEHAA